MNHQRTHKTKKTKSSWLSLPTRADHITNGIVFHLDNCAVFHHDHLSLNTLTIRDTPTKLIYLTTLTTSTDLKNHQEDKCRICIVYFGLFVYNSFIYIFTSF